MGGPACKVKTVPPTPPTSPLRESRVYSSFWGLLLQVAQLLDQARESDSFLGHLLPAPAHQLVHLSNITRIKKKKKIKSLKIKLQYTVKPAYDFVMWCHD